MRVLLTGAGGSIGIHVLDHIMLNTDWEVICTDSFRHKGYFDRISQTFDHNPSWRGRVSSITHDLTAPFSYREVEKLGKIDYIINLASRADVWESVEEPVTFVKNNVDIALNMYELARSLWGLRGDNHTPPEGTAFIQFSTDEVYGPSDRHQGHPEWSTILPSNPYSASKAAQESIGISYWRSYGLPLIITNTMNNFGQYQGSSKYPVVIQKALMAGEEVVVHTSSDGQIGTRHYIHSRNAADAILYILNNLPPHQHEAGEIDSPDRYNVVGDAHMDNLEIAQAIARLMGKELKYKLVDFHSEQPGHDLHYGLDGTKLRELGWKSPVSFDESMKATIDWQLANPEWIAER